MPIHSRYMPRLGMLAATISFALVGVVQAQSVPTQIPNSGMLLQQAPRQPTTVPHSDLDLRMLRTPPVQPASSHAFLVKSIQIEGNTLLPAKQLKTLVSGYENKMLTLGNLDQLSDLVSAAYAQAGYPLVRVYVPPQTLTGGVVKLAVVEARYGKVVLNNQSKVKDGPLNATLAPLQPGKPVANWTLERSLLLLSDIPGALTSSAIQPGDAAGTSDLVVNVTSAPRYTGTLGVDNYGNEYTGRARATGSLAVNGLLHQGDLLDFSAASSGGGMNFFQGGYRYLLNGQGTMLRAGVSSLHYHLGDALSPLGARGSALVGSLTLTQPIVRNTAANLYGQLEFDHKLLRDDIGLVGINNDRQANVWVATLAGDERDAHGITNYNLSMSHGDVDFTDGLTHLIDRITARAQGAYNKYTASISRLQRLGDHDALYAGFTQQWASKNLDTSEQFFLGGPNTVRGYDMGALGGSYGNLFTVEYRHDFSVSGVAGRWQAALFGDSGRITVYKNTFTRSINSARLNSTGIGLRWSGPHGWAASAAVAKPIGNTPVLLANANTKACVWLQVMKGFE